jgi:hypothetical protein
MLVSYCVECLPQKVVLGYNDRICELRTPHRAHPQTKKLGYFPISYKGWRQVFVEGDDAQTKENIIAQFGNEFV